MRVDDALRQERLARLDDRILGATERLTALVAPLLQERAALLGDRIRLFEETDPCCTCCRHASKKQLACWSCAGFASAPSLKALVERFPEVSGLRKADAEAQVLQTCKVCAGAPRKTKLVFNPRSHDQVKIILYDLLKMPKKMKDGALRSDEEALKDLLGQVAEAA